MIDEALVEPHAADIVHGAIYKALCDFLESKLAVASADDAREAFRSITMDMTVQDVDERLGRYDVAYNKLCKKTKNLRVNEKVMISFYIHGVRPTSVQKALWAETDCDYGT